VSDENALAVSQMTTIQRPMSLKDGVGLLPVEQQKAILSEYDDRRAFFLKWLFSHLKEGIHYGFPPGCEVKYNQSGDAVDYKGYRINPAQWIAKPSLYKAGAKLIIDLLRLKPQYSSDMDTWKMMGEPKGVVVRKCTLVNPDTGDIVGEGTGAFKVGEKTMMENSTVKMADKRADVAAVMNGIPVIGELFTQDIEEKYKERRKGNVRERQLELLNTVTNMLIDKKSKWTGEPAGWLKKAIVSVLGANAKLTSPGAIDAFEKALEAGEINIDTADKI